LKAFIDAPLFIYLNTLLNPKDRVLYEDFYIDILTKYKPYTDVLVLDELIYVSHRKYGVPMNISIEFIESNILPYIYVVEIGLEEYRKAVKYMIKHNLKPSDAIHLGACVNNGIETIVSEDKEFDKIKTIKRLWITT